MEVDIPGRGHYHLHELVLDVNGTVACGGHLIEGVRERLESLKESGWGVHWITADTRGGQAELDEELGWPAKRISTADAVGEAAQKATFVQALGAQAVVAIGNGSNDVAMLRAARLGIAVLGPEGVATDTMGAADLVAPDILSALDMLCDASRLVATLRK